MRSWRDDESAWDLRPCRRARDRDDPDGEVMSTMSEIDDIWEFVPTDDELELAVSTCAEEAALHVGVPTEWSRGIDDPARRDVATSDQEEWLTPTVADDEDDGRPIVDDEERDEELDVEELLERQHYAAQS
jgi:hypothetical protein